MGRMTVDCITLFYFVCVEAPWTRREGEEGRGRRDREREREKE